MEADGPTARAIPSRRRFIRTGRFRTVIDVARRAVPYLPVRQALPDGTTVWRYSGDRSMSRLVEEIYGIGVYELVPESAPKAGDTVLDIGAHVGVFAARATRMVGAGGQVIAIEADRRNFKLLARNAGASRAPRFRAIESALWSRSGELILHRDPSRFGAHSVVLDREGESVRVRARTLDDLVREAALPDPTLVKLDVEGAAGDILIGGRATLLRSRPRIVCAAYHTPDEARLLTETLLSLGYRVESRDARLQHTGLPETYLFALP